MRPVHPFEVRHRDVWSIALPATIAFISEPVAGLTDLAVIGRLGDARLLGGLVLGVLAYNFIAAMFFFLRIGTGGLVAQSVGARDPHEGLVHFARATILGIGAGDWSSLFSVARSSHWPDGCSAPHRTLSPLSKPISASGSGRCR